MALSRGRRGGRAGTDYWPGFVDILSTLLLVVTFLMSLFMLVQFVVSQEASSKDAALAKLQRQIAQLTDFLAMERTKKKNVEQELISLTATLSQNDKERTRLMGLVDAQGAKGASTDSRFVALSSDLDAQKKLSSEALAQVELLNQQIAALRRQIAALEQALDASEKRDKESQTQISDLGQRLNVALARKVQELARYRSDFFGKLRQVLGDREGVQVVGDRFVFQSEILFDSGAAVIRPEGLAQLDKLATALNELETQIPRDINWVLRVDGHTDVRPIVTSMFPSNWELSSGRAISVVKFLMSRGVPANRLAAAGFGENQPLAVGASDDDFRRNRRIELKLTER
jgi:chemotaxis protein MotB